MNRTVEFIVELVKIRDNILHISNDVFSLADIRDTFIYFLCTGTSRVDSFGVIGVFYPFCVFVCTPCTISY